MSEKKTKDNTEENRWGEWKKDRYEDRKKKIRWESEGRDKFMRGKIEKWKITKSCDRQLETKSYRYKKELR